MVRGPNQTVRFGFEPKTGTEPNRKLKNQTIDISVWFGSRRFETSTNRQQKSTYEDVQMHSYIYIYMHALYAACARDEKIFFFAENIELDCSFQKLLEFCKSDEN
jgi:hypothetical protein